MSFNGLYRMIICAGFILFAAAHLWLAFKQPVSGVFNIDERISVHSGLLLLLNSTPICLEWPGGPLLICISLIAMINMSMASEFVRHLINLELMQGSSEISDFIGLHLNSPDFYMWIRVIMHSLCLLSIPYLLFCKRIDMGSGGWLIPFGLIASPALLTHAMVIHPDSMAILIWSVLLIHVLYDRYKQRLTFLIITGFLSGSLIALKLTYFISIPPLLFFMAWQWRKEHGLYGAMKRATIFSGITLSFFLAFCPFITSQPLTMLKAFGGQLLVKSAAGSGSLSPLFLDYLPGLAAMPILLLGTAGLIIKFRKPVGADQLLLITLFLLFSLPFVKTASTYPRYAFPLLPIILIWSRAGMVFFLSTNLAKRGQTATVAFLLAFTATLWSANHRVERWNAIHFSCTNFSDLRNFIFNNIDPGTTIALDDEMKYLIPQNTRSLERNLALNRSPERIMKKLHVNEKVKSSVLRGEAGGFPVAEALFADHSNQAELLLQLQLDFLKNENTGATGYDVLYYSRDPYAEITTLKPEELDNIPGISYFIGFEEVRAQATMIRKFDGRCGRPVFIFKADS